LLPRGSTALDPASAAAARRERLLAATARLVADHGYAGITVGQIAAVARVPRRIFYAFFPNKEEALRAVQEEVLQGSIAAAAAGFSLPTTWPEQVWQAASATLTYQSANPDLAQLDSLETYAAGKLAIRRYQNARRTYTIFLEAGYRQTARAEGLPMICSEAIAGAISGLLRTNALRGDSENALAVLPQAAFVILAPFLDPRVAREFVAARAEKDRVAP